MEPNEYPHLAMNKQICFRFSDAFSCIFHDITFTYSSTLKLLSCHLVFVLTRTASLGWPKFGVRTCSRSFPPGA